MVVWEWFWVVGTKAMALLCREVVSVLVLGGLHEFGFGEECARFVEGVEVG